MAGNLTSNPTLIRMLLISLVLVSIQASGSNLSSSMPASAAGINIKVENRTVSNQLETKLFISNSTDGSLTGTLKWKVYDSLNQCILSLSRTVLLPTYRVKPHEETFNAALKMGVYRVVCYFLNEPLKIKVKNETYYLTVDRMNLPVAAIPVQKIIYAVSDAYQSPTNGNLPVMGFVKDRLNQFLQLRFKELNSETILSEVNFGDAPKEDFGLSPGKYLASGSAVWKFTQNQALKNRLDSIVYTLIHTQHKDGFLGMRHSTTYDTQDVESMKNNLSGLLAYYSVTGYKGALSAANAGGNSLYNFFNQENGNKKLFDSGGLSATAIMSPMLSLYVMTGDSKYLNFCYNTIKEVEKAGRPRLLTSLSKDGSFDVADIPLEDILFNLEALLKIYRITGNGYYLAPCKAAWDGIVLDPSLLSASARKDERLDALNAWTQFNAQLALTTGSIAYFNQIDKAIFQSKSPALQPFYPFGLMDNHPVMISYETGNFIDQLVTYDGSKVELTVQQVSRYPLAGNVSLVINPSTESTFTLSLRRPARSIYYKAIIDGKTYTVSPNHFLNIQRFWKKGDQIDIMFEMLPDYVTGDEENAAYKKEEADQVQADKKIKVRHLIRRSW